MCQVDSIEAKVEPGAGEASVGSQRGISNRSVLCYLTNRNFIHSHVPREECLSDMYLGGHISPQRGPTEVITRIRGAT